jgi:hypothetical protein
VSDQIALDGFEPEPEDRRAELLRRWKRGEKLKKRTLSILCAHSLLYDPHVDGRLRMSPAGRELLAMEGA